MKRAVLNGAVLFYRKRYVMPALKGKKNVGKNIKAEKKKHPNMSQKQAVAIALSEAGVSKKPVAKKKPSKLAMVMMAKVYSKKKKGGKC